MSFRKGLRTLMLAAALLPTLQVGAVDVTTEPGTDERLGRARAAIEAKNWSRAQFELREVERRDPNSADVHNLLGYLYRKQAKPDLQKAVEHYLRALRIDANHRGAHEYIGEAYLMLDQPAKAAEHLAKLETICGNRTCEEYADLQKAIEAYRKR